MSDDRRVEVDMKEPEPGLVLVTLKLRVAGGPGELLLKSLGRLGEHVERAFAAMGDLCEELEVIANLIEEGDLLSAEAAPAAGVAIEPTPPAAENAPSAPPPSPAAPPPPPPPVSKEPHLPEADVPEGSPDWLAPALKHAKAAKARLILKQLATDGNLTVQSVIYAFHPPMKEAYAQNVLSDVKQVLGQVGWTLERDNTGAYRARIKQ